MRKPSLSQTINSRDAQHVLTLEEIRNLGAKDSGKPAETLSNVVALIAGRFKTDVCSIYLLEPDRANLVLAATRGLRPQCVGTLRMALNEGLAGLVAEQVRPPRAHPRKETSTFQIFSRSRLKKATKDFSVFRLSIVAFLQGVLIVQTNEARHFREDEVRC